MILPNREFNFELDEKEPAERELFYRLLDPEDYVDFIPLARERIFSELSGLPACEPDLSGLFDERLELEAQVFPGLELPADLDYEDCRTIMRQFAPSALLGQCWLRNYSQVWNCDQEITSALFRAYRAGLNSKGLRSDPDTYRSLMRRLGIDLPPITTHAFCGHEQLTDNAFRRALPGLCMTRCAREFTGEFLGFTAADVLGLSGIFDQTLSDRFREVGIPDEYQTVLRRIAWKERPAVQEAIQAYLRSASDIANAKHKVVNGLRLYVNVDRSFWTSVLLKIEFKTSAEEKVLDLFRKKGRYGLGFHEKTVIGGIGLDEWFERELVDGEAFLNALADSDWFDSRNPDKSRFFTRLTAQDGVMAGVFTPAELELIRNWLGARTAEGRTRILFEIKKKSPASVISSALEQKLSQSPGPKQTKRELFYRLVNLHDFPEISSVARNHVGQCLRYTKLALRIRSNPELKPFRFSHSAFEIRVHSIYRRQVDAYSPLNGKPRWTRETWAWIIEQFAPTVLVDGCWLQQVNDPGMERCPVSEPLWRIYADEVGNGELRANHPMIYRHLLESLGIDLPPIHDPRFARRKGFVAGAFDIPVYLLAISLFSRSLLPELIGVNLAIELSGLGGAYLKLAESLEYWGIDPTIVRVHQSADNLAAGHSAIARDVISRYLDEILSLSGEDEMQKHWQRIWLGFASIRVVPLRFVASLAWHHLIRSTMHGIRTERHG